MNIKNAGRKNKYDTHIKPFLKDIAEYAKIKTESDIAKELGVSFQSFLTYKKEHKELAEALKKGQQSLVSELKSAIIKKAFGYVYEEEDTEFGVDENGKPIFKRKVIHKKHIPEDIGAIHLLLKNYDKDNWSNDWKALEIKQKQLEIDQKIAELKEKGW